MTTGNVYLLRQGLNLLDQINDELYVRASSEITQASVGGHLRHCLDFYDAFLCGLNRDGKIDYDLRERGAVIERDRLAAKAKIENAIEQLKRLSVTDESQDLLVKLEGEQAEKQSAWSRSSIRRELQFLLSHTVHHYALIAVLLRVNGFHPTPDFGIALSTLKYWQAKA